MLDLTFGEQVKIVLSRKGMTIKELAELIEEQTGKKMSRQNLTQRLSRDNFQEQDMRMIAAILGCPLHLSILDDSIQNEKISYSNVNKKSYREASVPQEQELRDVPMRIESDVPGQKETEPETIMGNERDITIGELVDIHEELDAIAQSRQEEMQATAEVIASDVNESEERKTEPAQEYAAAGGYEPIESNEAENESSEYEPVMEYESGYEAEQGYVEENGYESQVEYEEEPVYVSEEEAVQETEPEPTVEEILEEVAAIEAESRAEKKAEREEAEEKPHGWKAYLQRRKKKEVTSVPETEVERQPEYEEAASEYEEAIPEYEEEPAEYEADLESYEEPAEATEGWEPQEEEPEGDINPYTGREYESNSVRMHPKRIGYVQVYDRSDHQWTDMTEWAFLGYQERKKALLGKDYDPPIYLD